MTLLALHSISRAFRLARGKTVPAVSGVSLDLRSGELLALVGPSGSGKTTLLRIIAGLEKPDQGRVELNGDSLQPTGPDRGVAMVFQNPALLPNLNVRDNLIFPLLARSRPRLERENRAAELAKLLRIEHLLSRRPETLSGGEQQRVSLGRALAANPKLLLLDEPLSNLDPVSRRELRRELALLNQRLGLPMIFVTHDQAEALALGARVALMRAGAIEQIGSPREIYEQPATTFAAQFIGSPGMNILPAELLIENGLGAFVPAALSHAGPRNLLAGVRPERCELSAGGGIPVTVEWVESIGSESIAHCRCGERWIFVRVSGQSIPCSPARLNFSCDDVVWFDAATGLRAQ